VQFECGANLREVQGFCLAALRDDQNAIETGATALFSRKLLSLPFFWRMVARHQ
jgi:hypothetical protein